MYHTRRMFGSGLPGAWPFAAVALHHVPGFVGRFRRAVEVSKAFIERVTRHDAFAVERMPAPRTSSGCGCPATTRPASARGCATAASISGAPARTAASW